MKSRPRLIAILAVAGALSLAALYLIVWSEGNGLSPEGEDQGAGAAGLANYSAEKTPLPEASFETGTGEATTLKAFQGKTVLLNLWATWCVPCREEMPSLDRLQAKYGSSDFEVVAVSMDRNGVSLAKDFLAQVKATHLALYADPTSKMMFGLKAFGLPTTLIISPAGEIVGRFVGPVDWDANEARQIIEAAITAGKAQ